MSDSRAHLKKIGFDGFSLREAVCEMFIPMLKSSSFYQQQTRKNLGTVVDINDLGHDAWLL